jgi:uncharacterized protein YraI
MNQKIIISILVLALAAFACNMPGDAPDGEATDQPDLAATITAQALTLQAPTSTPEPPTQTPIPEATATITLTPTPGVPTASVSVNTNCRTGPSVQFDLIGALNVGQTAEVVGKYQNGAYWIIKTPGSSGNCWLWGNYATVSGNTSNLPEYPSPPTPTPSIPVAPSNFNANISCTLQNNPVFINIVSMNLSWTDNATNETGYRVYRNGELIKTLDANSTMTGDDTTLPAIWIINTPKPSVTYAVAAFNAAGESLRAEQTVSCP